jgi:hypothetical protein
MHRKLTACVLLGLSIFSTKLQAIEVFIEPKAGYFYPTDRTFREIYSGGGLYGGELTCQAYRNLYGWISADYFSKKGFSIGEQYATRITLVPLGAGIKYFFPFNSVDFYLGAGVLGTYLQMKDHSPYVIRNISKWGPGAIAKTGAIIKFSENIFADLFTSYTHAEMDFHGTDHGKVTRHHANLSGLTFGIGIVYPLGCSK